MRGCWQWRRQSCLHSPLLHCHLHCLLCPLQMLLHLLPPCLLPLLLLHSPLLHWQVARRRERLLSLLPARGARHHPA